jgi:hypothetical protein
MFGRIIGWSSLLGIAALAVMTLYVAGIQALPPQPGQELPASVADTLRGGACNYKTTNTCTNVTDQTCTRPIITRCTAQTWYDFPAPDVPQCDAPQGGTLCCGSGGNCTSLTRDYHSCNVTTTTAQAP